MADAVFKFGRQFGGTALVLRDIEQGVVTKAVFPPRRFEDDAFPTCLADQWHGIKCVAHIDEGALEPGAYVWIERCITFANSSDWCKVERNTTYGWVNARYLTITYQ